MNTGAFEIILASGSPRRKAFFEEMGIPFSQQVLPVEEVFPESLSGQAIVEHLVKLKAEPFKSQLKEKQLIITADTIVWHQNTGSPLDKAGAYGIQDSFGIRFVNSIRGSYTNIIGLPVAQVFEKLEEITKKWATS
ncbi:MAG: hypothetical protein EBY37_05180 [Flavobacteriia bacterium]|nr:hypothetical protein [Flavobacteriia bacterium]